MNDQYNTHPKHSELAAGDWNRADVKTCSEANRHPSHNGLVNCYE